MLCLLSDARNLDGAATYDFNWKINKSVCDIKRMDFIEDMMTMFGPKSPKVSLSIESKVFL
jgi:hypothetical protein